MTQNPEKMGLGEEKRLRLSFPDSQDSTKKVTPESMTPPPKDGARGRKPLAVVFSRLPRQYKKSHAPKYEYSNTTVEPYEAILRIMKHR